MHCAVTEIVRLHRRHGTRIKRRNLPSTEVLFDERLRRPLIEDHLLQIGIVLAHLREKRLHVVGNALVIPVLDQRHRHNSHSSGGLLAMSRKKSIVSCTSPDGFRHVSASLNSRSTSARLSPRVQGMPPVIEYMYPATLSTGQENSVGNCRCSTSNPAA